MAFSDPKVVWFLDGPMSGKVMLVPPGFNSTRLRMPREEAEGLLFRTLDRIASQQWAETTQVVQTELLAASVTLLVPVSRHYRFFDFDVQDIDWARPLGWIEDRRMMLQVSLLVVTQDISRVDKQAVMVQAIERNYVTLDMPSVYPNRIVKGWKPSGAHWIERALDRSTRVIPSPLVYGMNNPYPWQARGALT